MPTPTTTPPATRRRAARDLLSTSHLTAALTVHPADATVAAALRAGAAVGAALVLGHLSGVSGAAGFAALGALASVYVRWAPYRRRAELVGLAGLMITGSVLVASLTAAAGVPEPVAMLVVALVASGTTLLTLAVRTGPPGPVMAIFAAGAAVAGDPSLADAGTRTAATLAGAVIAWLVCTSGYLLRPSEPAGLAVRRALRDEPLDPARLAQARDVLADDLSHPRTAATARDLARLLVEVEDGETASVTADSHLRVPDRRSLWQTARDTVRSGEVTVPVLRIGAAALVASLVALALGWGHPAWAAVGAAATLQGRHVHTNTPRALQRALGTAVGALLAWPLLEAHLGFWAVLGVVVALQVVTELLVLRNYAVAMLVITPMALLMTSLGAPADGSLALDRALTTALGAAVGVLMTVLVHDRWEPRDR